MKPEPAIPDKPPAKDSKNPGGFGRLVTERFIRSGWHCRWCRNELVQDGAAVVCPVCDNPVLGVIGDVA